MKDVRKIRKYANALINVSKSNNLEETIQELILFKNILKQLPELRYLLSSKRVLIDNKIKSTKNIFSKYYNNITIDPVPLRARETSNDCQRIRNRFGYGCSLLHPPLLALT